MNQPTDNPPAPQPAEPSRYQQGDRRVRYILTASAVHDNNPTTEQP